MGLSSSILRPHTSGVSRPILSQLGSVKNCTKFADLLILRFWTCEMVGRVAVAGGYWTDENGKGGRDLQNFDSCLFYRTTVWPFSETSGLYVGMFFDVHLLAEVQPFFLWIVDLLQIWINRWQPRFFLFFSAFVARNFFISVAANLSNISPF